MKWLYLALASIILTAHLSAQEADQPRDGQLGEIIVTAGKREQALSDVPASVVAIDQARLELLGAQDATALLGRVAELSVETSQPGFSRFVIRGVNAGGQFGWRQGSATGIYLGDTPLTTRANFFFASPDINLFDMDRIEVLRGPQGTLFGAAAIGGAIRAMANIRLIEDRSAIRLVADYIRMDGFIDAILIGTQDYIAELPTAPPIANYNDSERLNLRASGAGDFALNTLRDQGRATVFACNPVFEATGAPDEFVRDEFVVGALSLTAFLDWLGGIDLVSATANQSRKAAARDDTVAANGSWVVGFGFDEDYLGLDPSVADFRTNVSQFTKELRLVTTGSQRLQVVAGLYFGAIRQIDDITYSFEGSPPPLLDNLFIPEPRNHAGRDRFREDELAAFVNADYRMSERLTETAGARLTYGIADHHYVATRDDPNYGLRANPQLGADLPAQNVVDVRFGIRSERFDVSIFARNLTNEDFALSQLALFATNAFRPTGIDPRTQREEILIRPRTMGPTVRAMF